jgi:hypothetical protein
MSILKKMGFGERDELETLFVRFAEQELENNVYYLDENALKESPLFLELISLEPEKQCEVILHAIRLAVKESKARNSQARIAEGKCRVLACKLIRRSLPYTESQFLTLCNLFNKLSMASYNNPQSYFAGAAERYRKNAGEFSPAIVSAIEKLHDRWINGYPDEKKWGLRTSKLLDSKDQPPPLRLYRKGEAFANQVLDDLESLDGNKGLTWRWLVSHASDCKPARPTAKWQKEAHQLADEVGKKEVIRRLKEWLPLINVPATGKREETYPGWDYIHQIDPMVIVDDHMDILKGFAWLSGLIADDELTRLLGFMGISSYKKIPGIGPRATRVGNACVWALGNIGSDVALAQLAIMKVRIKFGTAQVAISKALVRLAEDKGISPDELEEMSVPAYGMTEVGRLEEPMGDYTAVLQVESEKPILSFLKADGQSQKSVPAAIKETFKSDIKELRGQMKDIEKMLSAQKERLDKLFLFRKTWPLALWKERYLNHPLVGIHARRLIWSFRPEGNGESIQGIWYEKKLRDRHGNIIKLSERATVELWHPLDSDTTEIVAWRSWLFEHLIKQPFKQAHREIYLLTDAERNTEVYSNRFASHILRQHQFNSLCAARGWKNRLRLMVDDCYPPATKLLDPWGLRAEFWIEGIGDDFAEEYVTDSGAFRYLSTDQVRFYKIDAGQMEAHASGGGYGPEWNNISNDEPVKIEDVPPLVLSEVLRDVDLFVGVTSVGNDPNWSDGGLTGHYEDYWTSFSFGELGESAQMRKAMLEKLIPRLRIQKQCRLEGRFLIVEGSLRTYKIHLGSGNILMEPNDQYLCIVKAPSRTQSDKVFLPFEGDSKMTVILSKAFLLAADQKITDQTIIRQIK